MKIYIAHSRAFDFHKELYEPLREALGAEHQLILPHDTHDRPFSSRQLFEQRGCDIILAEVSFPSTGLGIELGWADSFGISIYALRQMASTIPDSIAAVASSITVYRDSKDLCSVVKDLLCNFTPCFATGFRVLD